MKKFYLIALAMAITLIATACSASKPVVSSSSAEAVQTPAATSAEATVVPEIDPTDPPAKTQLAYTDADIKKMLPLMDSAMLCQSESGATSHDATDAQYVWTYFYYLCVNHIGDIEGGVMNESGDSMITVPAATMEKLAYASFADITKLPAIPEDNKNISFNKKDNLYEFVNSDRGESYAEIASAEADGDKVKVVVNMNFEQDDSILYSKTFYLAASTKDTGYPFTIVSME